MAQELVVIDFGSTTPNTPTRFKKGDKVRLRPDYNERLPAPEGFPKEVIEAIHTIETVRFDPDDVNYYSDRWYVVYYALGADDQPINSVLFEADDLVPA